MTAKLWVPLAFFVLFATMVWGAQQQRATSVPGYLVVTTCGTLPTGITYAAATYQAATIDATGKFCVSQ
jgi:hypothetical protein